MDSDKIPSESETVTSDSTEDVPENGVAKPSPAAGAFNGDSGSDVAQVYISAFLIAALGFVVYLYAFNVPLHGEDLTLFGGDSGLGRIVTSLDLLPQMPTAPLSVLGLSVNAVIGGERLDIIHGGSIFLHLLCAILVFLIARQLMPRGTPEVVAMTAGMLFAAHPLASESVNYLVARSVLQSTFFGLAAVALLLRAQPSLRRGILGLTLAAVCFVLAFGSDTSAIFFPLVGVALVYLRNNRTDGDRDFRGVVAGVLVLLTVFMWVAGTASGLFAEIAFQGNPLTSLLAAMTEAGNGLYFGLLANQYSLLPVDSGIFPSLIALIALVGGLALGVKGHRLPGIVVIWVGLALLGSAFFGPATPVGPSRYLYVPWAAVCLLVPCGIQMVTGERPRLIAGGIVAVVILGLAGLSFQQCGQWTRPVELWKQAQEQQPESVRPALEIGRYLVSQLNTPNLEGDYRRAAIADALAAWSDVLDRGEATGEAQKNLGILSMEQENYGEALAYLRDAEARLPLTQEVALYRAYVAEQQARATGESQYMVESLRAFRRARKLGSLPEIAQERFGMLAAQSGDLATGLPLLEGLGAQGNHEAIEGSIKQFKAAAEQIAAVRAQSEEAQRNAPGSPVVLILQAQRSLLEGRTLSAFYLLQLALEQEPSNLGAWSLLGYVSARMDGADHFLSERGTAQAGNWEAWMQLSGRCAAGGVWSAAESYLRYGAQQQFGERPIPELALSDIAMTLQQPERSAAYLEAAQTAYPARPEPWLRAADVAIASGDMNRARGLVGEAEKRQADPAAIKERMEKLGEKAPAREGITRTVIQ